MRCRDSPSDLGAVLDGCRLEVGHDSIPFALNGPSGSLAAAWSCICTVHVHVRTCTDIHIPIHIGTAASQSFLEYANVFDNTEQDDIFCAILACYVREWISRGSTTIKQTRAPICPCRAALVEAQSPSPQKHQIEAAIWSPFL